MTARDPLSIVGQTIADKYLIESMVGEGGFAVVYRAIHRIWNKPVAIKFFTGLSMAPVEHRKQFEQAFIQEGALLTELSSQTATIVQARDIGTYVSADGAWVPFMVLEWLEGATLEHVLEDARVRGARAYTLDSLLPILGQVAHALDVAHQRGIAHRDVKPANLFLLAPAFTVVKLLDFGVAKMVTDNTQLQAAMARTGMGITSFTPQYGAPEQFNRSVGATGPWTDVFALALVAVEMLIGRPALDGEDVIQLAVSAGRPDQRPTPQSLGVNVSPEVEAVFAKALAVRPQDRYARARDFWTALEAATQAPAQQRIGSGLDVTELAPLNITAPIPSHAPQTAAASRMPLPQPAAPPVTQSPSLRPMAPTTSGNATLNTTQASAKARSHGALFAAGLGVLAVIGAGVFLFNVRNSPQGAASASAERANQEHAAAVLPAAAASSASPAAAPEPSCPERSVKIAAGQFYQGSDRKDALPREQPAHNVTLKAYCIDLYEVTAGEYKACSDQGQCKRASTEVDWPNITPADKARYSPVCTVNDPERKDHPINCVSWEMADRYCKVQGKRLPTEAEWEYAARGPDGRVYPWGDEPPTAQHLNACGKECAAWGRSHGAVLEPLYAADDGFPTTAPVGRFEAGRSRFGPYDIVGNVWEWVADYDGPYTAEDKQNPTGPASGDRRVIRGGGWNGSDKSWLRPSYRYAQAPEALSHGVGFRCVKSL
ncbi:MAG TPA: bifunctional serine/threonine-protein kinase/formylglycine-generating enzyme family protein [Polyangiaceae bacterium]|nr:bifunctional serine/threonine-protein kinase/formylglycine-generating enzyme family protein [Polyangiaceae bacterium]